MTMGYLDIPQSSWRSPVAFLGSLPGTGNSIGDARVVTATNAIYVWNGTQWVLASGGGGSGTVTSVALTAPSILNVSGSPITTAGTIALTLATQSANTVFAGPTSGGDATPTFRALVADDIPSLSSLYVLKAGDTMTGQLNVPTIGDPTAVLAIDTTNRTLNNSAGASMLSWDENSPSIIRGHSDFVVDNGRSIGILSSTTTINSTSGDSAGTIPDGIYAYKVTVVLNGDETVPGIPSFVFLTDGSDTNSCTIVADYVRGASQYNFYRAINPTLVYGLIGSSGGPTFVDDGSNSPGGPPPVTSIAESTRITNQNALIGGDLQGKTLNFINFGSSLAFNEFGIYGVAATGDVVIGANAGNFDFYGPNAGLQFDAAGNVNLYNNGNSFNITASPGGTVLFHANNSGLDFNFDGTSLLYTSKFQINASGTEQFEVDTTNGVRVWDASGNLSADFQNRQLLVAGNNILDYSDITRGLLTPTNFTGTSPTSKLSTKYTGTPSISLASQINGGSLVDTTTYYWVVTAIIQGGLETIASNEVSFTMASPDLTQEILVSPVPGATQYNLYRGTSPGIYDGIYYSINSPYSTFTAFVDDGTTSPIVQQPPINSLAPSSYISANEIFTMGDALIFGNLQLGGVTGLIKDYNGVATVDVKNRVLIDSVGNTSFDWNSRLQFDSSSTTSIAWENRLLNNISGNTVLDWSGNNVSYGTTLIDNGFATYFIQGIINNIIFDENGNIILTNNTSTIQNQGNNNLILGTTDTGNGSIIGTTSNAGTLVFLYAQGGAQAISQANTSGMFAFVNGDNTTYAQANGDSNVFAANVEGTGSTSTINARGALLVTRVSSGATTSNTGDGSIVAIYADNTANVVNNGAGSLMAVWADQASTSVTLNSRGGMARGFFNQGVSSIVNGDGAYIGGTDTYGKLQADGTASFVQGSGVTDGGYNFNTVFGKNIAGDSPFAFTVGFDVKQLQINSGSGVRIWDNSGIISGDFQGRNLNDGSGIGSINWAFRNLNDGSGNDSVDWGNRRALDSTSITSYDWENRSLKYNNGNDAYVWQSGMFYDFVANNQSLSITNRQLLDANQNLSEDWNNRQLVNSSGTVTLDWQNGTSTFIEKQLVDFYADAGNTTTTETDLYSYTTTANRLNINGEKLEAEHGGIFVSSATATRRIKGYFGGTLFFDTGALTLSLSSAWTMYTTIIRVSSTVVRYMVSFTTEGAALAAYTATGEITGLTLSNTNILKITGQAAGVGAATNDIVAKIGNISWKPAA